MSDANNMLIAGYGLNTLSDPQSVHKADFHRTYNAFWIHVERGERRFDPCWLACLCLVLAVVLQARPDLQQEDLVPSDLYALGRACLELHDWRRKPNYRVIQTLFMCLFYCNNESDCEHRLLAFAV